MISIDFVAGLIVAGLLFTGCIRSYGELNEQNS